MRFGVYLIQGLDPGPSEFGSADYLSGVARRAEDLGFDSIWLPEHVAIPSEYTSRYPYQNYRDDSQFEPYPWADAEFPDPIAAMAFIGARTDRLQLRTGTLILPLRNPVILAKELATIDRLTGGRVHLGVGLGWMREEFEAIGAPWAGRGRRVDEAIEAMRALWTQPRATYHGQTVSFDRLRLGPRPPRAGGIPVAVGGGTEAAARRAGRLGDGFIPARGYQPDQKQYTEWLLATMRSAAVETGRDPDAIEICGFGADTIDGVRALEAAGFDHLYYGVGQATLAMAQSTLERIATTIVHPYSTSVGCRATAVGAVQPNSPRFGSEPGGDRAEQDQ